MSNLAIETRNLHKSYRMGKVDLHVLRGVSFGVKEGEFVGVVGASGSGKSTLLHLVGLLDNPDKGSVELDGVDVFAQGSTHRNRLRCRNIGFVFQFYHLLPEFNVLENVLMPAQVDASILAWPSRRSQRVARAKDILGRMGLGERLAHRPKELSGGERQRVAIARAMMNEPKILLADEPTGNLDSKTGRQILDVLREFHAQRKQTILMVTHDMGIARECDRVLHLVDGRLAENAPA
jgi:lipoprotein-releasing system ATP-binding protein